MTDQATDGAWFLPKRYGYGSGMPITWQGWLVVVIHAGLIISGALWLHRVPAATAAWMLITGFLPLPLYAAKTRGGWKWRWSGKD